MDNFLDIAIGFACEIELTGEVVLLLLVVVVVVTVAPACSPSFSPS